MKDMTHEYYGDKIPMLPCHFMKPPRDGLMTRIRVFAKERMVLERPIDEEERRQLGWLCTRRLRRRRITVAAAYELARLRGYDTVHQAARAGEVSMVLSLQQPRAISGVGPPAWFPRRLWRRLPRRLLRRINGIIYSPPVEPDALWDDGMGAPLPSADHVAAEFAGKALLEAMPPRCCPAARDRVVCALHPRIGLCLDCMFSHFYDGTHNLCCHRCGGRFVPSDRCADGYHQAMYGWDQLQVIMNLCDRCCGDPEPGSGRDSVNPGRLVLVASPGGE